MKDTKYWISILTICLFAGSTSFASEWINLFNGKDLAQWENPYDWGKAEIVDGEIHLTTEKSKWFLSTVKEYADFIFEVEVKMPEGKCNSGFLFRSHKSKNKMFGYQAEVDPSERNWSGGLYDEGRRKWFISPNRDHAASKQEKEQSIAAFIERAGTSFKRHGWNKYRIECRGDHIKISVNGVTTTDIHDQEDAKGYIALQHHGEKGQTYRFRNIRIMELSANQVSKSQQKYVAQYKKQSLKVAPEAALINTDQEPSLKKGFVNLYNGKNLDGWTPRGGTCTFEASGESIIGTCVKGSPNTYLSTDRENYGDFIFTAELKWAVDGNSGIMFRAKRKPGKQAETIYGPQCEMEGFEKDRGWSGGIYGQSAGGWRYPLWLEAHKKARKALKKNEWNRITIKAVGTNVKTWVNGVPAANWESDEYLDGFFGLQIHSGKQGEVHFRNIKVKELEAQSEYEDLFADGTFSKWQSAQTGSVRDGWRIRDGVIKRTKLSDGQKRPGDITTLKHYKDFDLKFDWKISEGGNSGVKYRTRGSLGLEYQVLDDGVHKDKNLTAGIYALVPAAANKPYNAAKKWNSGRIIVKGNHTEHWINGVKVAQVEIGSEDWLERLNKSKYKKHDGFGTWTGPILLQDHNDPVSFRNVRIKEL